MGVCIQESAVMTEAEARAKGTPLGVSLAMAWPWALQLWDRKGVLAIRILQVWQSGPGQL
jgi:hypothetical protein